ncbi:MAG: hypothetical protein ACLUI3_05665 [Christensenellales bacterium]
MNALCERAPRISQQGAAITDEEMAALDVPFGQGVGASYTVGAGIRAGGEQWYLVSRTACTRAILKVWCSSMRPHPEPIPERYGAYGRTVRKDIESALASGTLDENYANALRRRWPVRRTYTSGIDPMDFEGISSEQRGGAPGHRDDGRIHAHERDGG